MADLIPTYERKAALVEMLLERIQRYASEGGGRGDFESAHMEEKDLQSKVLGWIAHSQLDKHQMRQLALMALRSEAIDFERYFA